MSKSLYDEFPHIVTDELILRKMTEADLDALFEICCNDRVYEYCPQFLYTKSKPTLKTAIHNLGQRDFEKKRWIIAGICLSDKPEKIVGTAEMFDYDSEVNKITIGYKINESFWGQGIATKAVAAMIHYLFHCVGVNRVQAFVMPENTQSQKVLLKNGFTKEGLIRQGYVWKGKGAVDLLLFSLLKSEATAQIG